MDYMERVQPLLDITRKSVKDIALARAAATVADEMPAEEFDKFLNEQCEEAYAEYEGLGREEVMMKIMLRIARHNPGMILDLLLGGAE